MGSHWTAQSTEVTRSDLHFKWIPAAAERDDKLEQSQDGTQKMHSGTIEEGV